MRRWSVRVPVLSICLVGGLLGGLVGALAGCGSANTTNPNLNNTIDGRRDPLVEEPDLFQRDGDTLYVQNPDTGLNIIDTRDPQRPRLLGRVPVVGGDGSQILVQPDSLVVVLLKGTGGGGSCQLLEGLSDKDGFDAEVDLVDASSKTSPRLHGRWCVPGSLVASRTVGQVLYLVTTARGSSRALAVDLKDPAHPKLLTERAFAGASREILVTSDTIIVVSRALLTIPTTLVQYFSIGTTGAITARGTIEIPGEPQGRFHMDLSGGQFRIVTFAGSSSTLTVVDVLDPDHLSIIGAIDKIGLSEKLYATRFDGDLAYVVTFRRTDPLYVISLADPTRPQLVGELRVPGWSDYLFPRGNKLIAVGHGDNGRAVAVSLFDVTDPTRPTSLSQIELGTADSTSEAQLDHRGVSLIDDGTGAPPVLVVPVGTVRFYNDPSARRTCTVSDYLQLVEVRATKLQARGTVAQKGAIKRSFPVGGSLYGLSDVEVQAIDITQRDAPVVQGALQLGDEASYDRDVKQTCDDALGHSYGYCRVGRTPGEVAGFAALLLFSVLAVTRRRRARLLGVVTAVVAAVVLLPATARAQSACQLQDCDPRMELIDENQPQPQYQPPPPPATLGDPAAQPAPSVAPAPYYTPTPYYFPPATLPRERKDDRRVNRITAGVLLFAIPWSMTALYGGALLQEWRLAIPVAGPIVSLAHYRERFQCANPPPGSVYYCGRETSNDVALYTFLVFDALAQAAGVAIAAWGIFGKITPHPKNGVNVTFAPSVGGGSLAVTFH